MQVTANQGTTQTGASSGSRAAAKDQLDQDAFLKLMMAQLRFQDPLKPLEDKEFLAQTAQFNALTEMREMNQAFQNLLALQSLAGGADFIGKQVEVMDPQTEVAATGEVRRVALGEDGLTLYLKVPGADGLLAVPMSAVVSVSAPGSPET